MTPGSDALEDVEYGLTIHWPWCEAIATGPKRIENRTWQPWDRVIGRRIAIHCGQTVADDAIQQIRSHPGIDWSPYRSRDFDRVRGCIVGTAIVGGWWSTSPSEGEFVDEDVDHPLQLASGELDWQSEYGDPDNSPWWSGSIGWLLVDVMRLEVPVPARGAQGLWEVGAQIEAAIDRCGRCGRPDGQTVAVLETGAWRDDDGQWHGAQGFEIDIIPSETAISESRVALQSCDLDGETLNLCASCRERRGIGTQIDSTGQGLLV